MTTKTAEEIDAAIAKLQHLPPGYRLDLLLIAYTKMVLARVPMKEREQLEWLEKLDDMSKKPPATLLTPAVIAAVPALSDPSARIVEEAHKLDGEPERRDIDGIIVEIPSRNSSKLLASEEVFSTLVRMNPGLVDVIGMMVRV